VDGDDGVGLLLDFSLDPFLSPDPLFSLDALFSLDPEFDVVSLVEDPLADAFDFWPSWRLSVR
jgi:hypothetical protein